MDLRSDEERYRSDREVSSLIALASGAGAVRGIVERGDAIDRLFRHIEELQPVLVVIGNMKSVPVSKPTVPVVFRCMSQCLRRRMYSS